MMMNFKARFFLAATLLLMIITFPSAAARVGLQPFFASTRQYNYNATQALGGAAAGTPAGSAAMPDDLGPPCFHNGNCPLLCCECGDPPTVCVACCDVDVPVPPTE